MACRQTGFVMLCSSSVQEVMDLALVSHISSLKSRLPFMHFFDGYRTSAEVSKIQPIPFEAMKQVFPYNHVSENLHKFALNSSQPMIRGTGQRPDIFFQSTVAANKYYEACPEIVEESMKMIEALTGRSYKLFDYHGSPTAERVMVIMGSAAKTAEETVDHLNQLGENVGVVTVRLFRPWSAKHFLSVLPPTVKKVAVMDRTREDGAIGMPLFLDVNVSLAEEGLQKMVTGGQYGLASKEFSPNMIKAIFDNLNAENPKRKYVIGIDDDVTHTSLSYGANINTVPPNTKQCVFWGLGSDGTVGSSKQAIKTIGLNTDLYAQGHFVYDSHKADGVTISHVRFGPSPIKSEYEISSDADYVSCAHPSYVYKFDQILDPLKEGGIFVLNSPWNSLEVMEKKLPAVMKRKIAEKKAQFYNLSANELAQEVGLGKRINMMMQSVFYSLAGVLPEDKSMDLLKQSIEKAYNHKGPDVVQKNIDAVHMAKQRVIKIDYPASWISSEEGGSLIKSAKTEEPEFVTQIMNPVLELKGDVLPVSAFTPGGYQPIGTTEFEKRGIAPNIPVWVADNCTQCNYCAIVCPHAVVRPFMLDKHESKSAPPGFEVRKAKGGAEVSGLNYTIQISPNDCTGCEVCVESCPDDALYMAPYNDVADEHRPHWDYAISLPDKGEIGDKYTVKGSQFLKPLFEFSGACAGCGETPYLKLATQLYGDRMVIANSSGCSSVWGGTSTTIPFTKNKEGHGPAWGRSLFEDTAEYGLGMFMATRQRRQKLKDHVAEALDIVEMSKPLQQALTRWLKVSHLNEPCDEASAEVMKFLPDERTKHPIMGAIFAESSLLRRQSQWIVGGDGWAYDIGFGGLDHIFAKGEDVNILVLDTEMYSNTGGQVSKATQLSTVTKFASSGKRQNKKDLGMVAMGYGDVYVGSVALGANMNQTVQAFKEAESYPGTSLIIAYSPCIDWGIEMKNMMDQMKLAVESGYWNLYRYDPRRVSQGMNPLQLDSKKIKSELMDYLYKENRFKQLVRKNSDVASSLHSSFSQDAASRRAKMLQMSYDDYEMLDHLKKKLGEQTSSEKVTVLYGSETGNAETLAGVFGQELKRRGIRAKISAMDDFDLDELAEQDTVFGVVATCGQGELPANCKTFFEQLSNKDLPADFLKNTKFSVFGLGDSSYVYFNEAALKFDKRFEELGAQRLIALGMGDDKDEERFETKWNEWSPELWNELGTPPPPMELNTPTYSVAENVPDSECIEHVLPQGSKLVPMVKNELLTPADYDRDIRHFEFDLAGTGMSYAVGECLGIYPHNDAQEVAEFCENYGLDPDMLITLEDTLSRREPLPSPITVEKMFREVLDIFGRPPRRFFETLSIAALDPSERDELQYILSKEGSDRLKELQKETATFAELMNMYPSSKLSLPYLLDHVPRIKPRLYSIASSQEMKKNILDLCVVKEDWTTPSGKYRHGLSTRYLQHKSEGGTIDYVAGKINGAGITIPDTQAPPYLMVGLGTGLAPLRAMIEDREVARVRGEQVGEMALFFGARYKRTDYTYGDELEAYNEKGGVLTHLINAFSRDQKHKIYVNHRIEENPEIVYDYLVKKKGYFYLCGPAGNVPASVRKAIRGAFLKCGGMKDEEAEQYIIQMQIDGRYNIEAW